MTGDPDVDSYLAVVDRHLGRDPSLSNLQAGLLAAADLGIAEDSRTFSRMLGVSHAIVLRELGLLSECGAGLRITRRDDRTLRTYYSRVGEQA